MFPPMQLHPPTTAMPPHPFDRAGAVVADLVEAGLVAEEACDSAVAIVAAHFVDAERETLYAARTAPQEQQANGPGERKPVGAVSLDRERGWVFRKRG